ENVIVTHGAKQAIYNAMMALLNSGDEVLIFSPYWLSYPEMVKLAGGVPRIIQTDLESGFKVSPQQLANAINAKTRLVIFNSPSNPSGVVYTIEEYQALGHVLKSNSYKNNMWILSDEIYDQMVFTQAGFCSFLKACPEFKDQTITVNGMSKCAAMTGWRVGWSVAPKSLTQAMNTIQGQSTSGVNVLAQWASIAVLKLPQDAFRVVREIYSKRCRLGLEILRNASKLKLRPPEGAFYFFVGFSEYVKEDSIEFSEKLLQKARIAVVPGTPFGEKYYVRLSFATDDSSLQKGLEGFVSYLNKL
ncbi:MAG: aminotransferase class I/II-fold pyridoxal phosphate-dependent enzyme, partial [Deltaproteobacteria bacterium]|nr:aminotransferase class I/II-fold pyridoxal phosphate-dependent enzyme [Deltaproteobacteria bacterium]